MRNEIDDKDANPTESIPLTNYISLMKGNDPFVRMVVLIIAAHVLGVFEKASTAMC